MSKRILVVEHDEATLEALGLAFRRAGLEPVSAPDAATALVRFREATPSAVLIAVGPGQETTSLVTELRKERDGAIIPVLFMGEAHLDDEVRSPSDALAVGGDYFFKLPTDLDYLAGRVLGWTGESNSTISARLDPTPLDLGPVPFAELTDEVTELTAPIPIPITPRLSAAVPDAPLDDGPTAGLPDRVASTRRPTSTPRDREALEMVKEGERLRTTGHPDAAVEAYAAAAEVYEAAERIDPALALHKLIVHLDPTRLELAQHAADLARAHGKNKDAIEILRRPAKALEAAERFEDAAQVVRTLIELSPSDPALVLKLASLESKIREAARPISKPAHAPLAPPVSSGNEPEPRPQEPNHDDWDAALARELALSEEALLPPPPPAKLAVIPAESGVPEPWSPLELEPVEAALPAAPLAFPDRTSPEGWEDDVASVEELSPDQELEAEPPPSPAPPLPRRRSSRERPRPSPKRSSEPPKKAATQGPARTHGAAAGLELDAGSALAAQHQAPEATAGGAPEPEGAAPVGVAESGRAAADAPPPVASPTRSEEARSAGSGVPAGAQSPGVPDAATLDELGGGRDGIDGGPSVNPPAIAELEAKDLGRRPLARTPSSPDEGQRRPPAPDQTTASPARRAGTSDDSPRAPEFAPLEETTAPGTGQAEIASTTPAPDHAMASRTTRAGTSDAPTPPAEAPAAATPTPSRTKGAERSELEPSSLERPAPSRSGRAAPAADEGTSESAAGPLGPATTTTRSGDDGPPALRTTPSPAAAAAPNETPAPTGPERTGDDAARSGPHAPPPTPRTAALVPSEGTAAPHDKTEPGEAAPDRRPGPAASPAPLGPPNTAPLQVPSTPSRLGSAVGAADALAPAHAPPTNEASGASGGRESSAIAPAPPPTSPGLGPASIPRAEGAWSPAPNAPPARPGTAAVAAALAGAGLGSPDGGDEPAATPTPAATQPAAPPIEPAAPGTPALLPLRPLLPAQGNLRSLSDVITLFAQLRAQRSTGLLHAEGLATYAIVHGEPAALRGEMALDTLLVLLEPRLLAATPIPGPDDRPVILGRDLVQRGKLRERECFAYLHHHLELGVLALLRHRGPFRFESEGAALLREELVPEPTGAFELLVDLLPWVVPGPELLQGLGGPDARLRAAASPGHLTGRDARFAAVLDGQHRLEDAARLAMISLERAAALGTLLVGFGRATVVPAKVARPLGSSRPEPAWMPLGLGPPPQKHAPLPVPEVAHDSLPPAPVPHAPLQSLEPKARLAALAELVRTSDYFTILGVDHAANKSAIDQAHHRLRSLVAGPEHQEDPESRKLSAEVLRSLDEARDVLKIPELRTAYLRHLKP